MCLWKNEYYHKIEDLYYKNKKNSFFVNNKTYYLHHKN